MSRETYTLTHTVAGRECAMKVRANGHEQHIWSETTLVGVSRYAAPKLDAFRAEAAQRGVPVIVEAGQHWPRLIGYELRA